MRVQQFQPWEGSVRAGATGGVLSNVSPLVQEAEASRFSSSTS